MSSNALFFGWNRPIPGREKISAELDALMTSPEWIDHVTRALIHLEGAGVIRGVTGDLIQPRMELWTGLLPH